MSILSTFTDRRFKVMYRYARKAFGGYKKEIIILTILGFVSGLLEGIGVNALIPLFSFAVGQGQASDPISQMIERFFELTRVPFSVPYLLIFIAILFVGKAFITIRLDLIKLKITHEFEQQMRKKIFRKILASSWPHLIKQKLGHLETILMIDVPAGATLMKHVSGIIIILTGLIVYVIVAVNISFVITVWTLLVGAISFLFIKHLIYRTKILATETAVTNKDSAHHVSENIYGVKTVKSMMIQDGVVRKGDEYFEKLKNLVIKINYYRTITASFIQPVAIIFICVLFALTFLPS